MAKQMTALIIMDGFGLSQETFGNAVSAANTPCLDALCGRYPHTTLHASGMAVGLPDGQMGNSEVGHLNIGAGRIVYQEFTRITKSVRDGDFFQNERLCLAVRRAREKGTKLHLIGLLSDGGVHSHMEHLYALLQLAKQEGLREVYVHCLLDGRDVPPTSGKGFVEALEAEMRRIGIGKIATVMGRYWAMDRDKRWERVRRGYDAIALGEGRYFTDAAEAVQASYDADETDEFVQPVVIVDNGTPTATVAEGDSIIFFNFRPDRAREITRAFIEVEFDEFPRARGYIPVNYVSMTQYDATFTNLGVAFAPQTLANTIGEYLSKNGLKQLRIAETEKYAHVTFFFNGGVEESNIGEDRVLIPSPKVATYDLQPEMSAYEVAEEAVSRIESGTYDVMVLNFANPDMVGHTGVMEAAVKAVEAVDACVGKVVDAVLATGGQVIITADHGNADMMVDPESGGPFTAHTTNDVPCILCDDSRIGIKLRSDGCLADLAPTMLELLRLPKPAEMKGTSLLKGK